MFRENFNHIQSKVFCFSGNLLKQTFLTKEKID